MKLSCNGCLIHFPQPAYNFFKTYTNWLPCAYISSFFDELVPNFLNQFVGAERRSYLKEYFSSLDPRNSLGYFSDKSYLEAHNLSEDDVISNSIEYVFDTLDKNDYIELVKSFTQLVFCQKVKVIRSNGLAIYKEIVDALQYIKQIQELLRDYPLQCSEYKGSAHSSKYKGLAQTQIRQLVSRLEHVYFPIKDQGEIEYTKTMIDLIKSSVDEKFKSLPDGLNFINIFFGLDSKMLGLDKRELEVYRDFLNFYNGIKTERIELVQSVTLYISILFKKSQLEEKDKAILIRSIVEIFFIDEINTYDKSPKNKQTFVFNAQKLKIPTRIKTMFHNVPIFAYSYKNSNDFLLDLIQTGIHVILGMHSNADELVQQEVSDFTSLRGLAEFKRKTGFGKKELKVLDYYIKRNT